MQPRRACVQKKKHGTLKLGSQSESNKLVSTNHCSLTPVEESWGMSVCCHLLAQQQTQPWTTRWSLAASRPCLGMSVMQMQVQHCVLFEHACVGALTVPPDAKPSTPEPHSTPRGSASRCAVRLVRCVAFACPLSVHSCSRFTPSTSQGGVVAEPVPTLLTPDAQVHPAVAAGAAEAAPDGSDEQPAPRAHHRPPTAPQRKAVARSKSSRSVLSRGAAGGAPPPQLMDPQCVLPRRALLGRCAIGVRAIDGVWLMLVPASCDRAAQWRWPPAPAPLAAAAKCDSDCCAPLPSNQMRTASARAKGRSRTGCVLSAACVSAPAGARWPPTADSCTRGRQAVQRLLQQGGKLASTFLPGLKVGAARRGRAWRAACRWLRRKARRWRTRE